MAAAADEAAAGAQHVARVLGARHAFEVLELAVSEQEEGDVKRAYRRLALLLHPDKNPHDDAKLAFVRVADAYDQLRDPEAQRKLLASLRRKPSSSSHKAPGPPAAKSRKPSRSFKDVLREWEEFEREFFSAGEEAHKAAERQHRAEKKRSQMADRAEREAAERQRLADVVLEDEEGLQARSDSWAAFQKGKGKRRKKRPGTGDGGDG